MKLIFTSLFLIAASVIFYSCKSDSVVTPTDPTGAGGYQWTQVSSLVAENFDKLAACDENTVIAGSYQIGYKITNGSLSYFNFQDTTFNTDNLAAYDANYFAFCSTNFTSFFGNIKMKIFTNGVMSTVVLDTHSTSKITDMLITAPGKIAAVTGSKLYIYDNGSISSYASPDSFSTGFNLITKIGSALYIAGNTRKIYKFENNVLSIVSTETGTNEFSRMKVFDAIIKAPYSPQPTVVSYWNGPGWNTLCTDTTRDIYLFAAGESINSIYFLVADSALSYSKGKIWTGSHLADDPNYPPDNPATNVYTTALSNMKNNTVFISKRENFTSKIYRGVKNY
ncbi:MAG: hypothetical protein JST55_14820 [Bacteroidetes bacterium]|nr:hypothetical protein [Bacteroidota bacterium]